MTAAALAAVLLLVGAASAWGAFVKEGSPHTVGDDPYSLKAADFNGDGRPDVATINGTSSNVSVFLRQPGGGFAQEAGSPVATGSGPSGAAVGDYNGDGRLDLAVANFVGQNVTVLLRQPSGGFAAEAGAPSSLGSATAIGAGDFNSDGRIDLAVTRSDTNQISLFFRNGANTGFSAGPQFPTGLFPRAIAVADYNGDGLADLAIANRDGDSVTVMRRSGATFVAEAPRSVGDDPEGIVAADFDGNGRADFAVTNAALGRVSAFLRSSTNTGFIAEPVIQVSAAPVGIAAGDLDRDGRPDLAVAANSGAVEILRRNPGGRFTRDPAIALAGAVNGIAVADFDGDGGPDLAASSYTGATADTFSVLLNRFPAPPQEPPPLPPPVAGKSVNVEPVSGTVKIKLPGRKRFVTLTAGAQIPTGSTIDTRRGRIAITAAQGKGKTATMDFYQGLFKLAQTKGRKPLTTLTLTERLSCPRKQASSAAKKKKKRRLWGNGKGRFRTKGKHSAATVVGTKYLVQDRCGSTLTRVVRGRVKVRDFAKRKTVTVRAGKRYTARAKRT
jgi:hypothetical protein